MILYIAHKHRYNIYTTMVGLEDQFKSLVTMKEIGYTPEHFIIHLPSRDRLDKIPPNPNLLREIRKHFEVSMHCYDSLHQGMGYILGCNVIPLRNLHTRAGNIFPVSQHVDVIDRKSDAVQCKIDRLMRQNILLPDGKVVLCCMDYGLRHVLGNLLTDSYRDLFRSQTYRDLVFNLSHNGDALCRYCSESMEINGSTK
jgi:hypothetical protein